MRGFVPPDPQTDVSSVHYAIVYAPRRKANRHRIPQSCVEIKNNKEQAMEQSSPASNRYAAQVLGPSKSSEGQYIFYVMEWLE